MRILTLLFILCSLTASAQQVVQIVRWTSQMDTPLIHSSDTIVNDSTVSKLYALEAKPGRTYYIYEYLTELLQPQPPAAIRVVATSFAQQSGIVVVGDILGGVDKADWIKYSVALTDKHKKIVYRYAMSDTQGGGVEFRTGSITGPVFASAQLPVTGGWSAYVEIEIQIPTPLNASEIFVTFTNSPRTTGSGGNINWFEFR